MATSGIINHLSSIDAILSDGPDTDTRNYGRSYGNIPEDLHLLSLYCSHSSDHLSHCSLVFTSLWILSTKL